MKLTLRGVEYQSDLLSLYDLTINEARAIKANTTTHMTIADWRVGLITFNREDPDVLAALIYLLRHRAGEIDDWDAIGDIRTRELTDGFEWEESDTELVNRVQQEQDARFDEAVAQLLESEPAAAKDLEQGSDADSDDDAAAGQDVATEQGPAST